MIEAGQQLLHYRVVEKLGAGGMGEVWLAEDRKLNRRIALKVLPQHLAADADRRARFEREAQVVAGLNHPNIVTIHAVEEHDGIHFITMELVEGRTLSTMIPRGGFELGKLLEFAIPLADAVHRAHRAGITHRDLKPDNIMVDTDGRLRVLDFGLAKLADAVGRKGDTLMPTATAVTGEGKIVGTVAYMSPEQAEGGAVDHRSDIFSLGTILYEMASGRRPFQGDTSMSTIGSILKEEPPSVTEVNRKLPRHAGRIIRRCLAKEPDRRYQTALDLRNELEELRSEIDSGVHEAGSAAAPARRGWLPILLGAIALVAVVALFVTLARRPGVTAPELFDSVPLTSTRAWAMHPDWSPDGQSLAMSRMSEGNVDVLIQPLDGSEAVVRAGGPGDQVGPRWSADGKYLAYVSSFEPGSWVYIVPAYGGTPRKLVPTNIPALHFGTLRTSMGDRPWAPDGSSLLVSLAVGDGLAIHRVPFAGGEPQKLTSPPPGGMDLSPSHSFDGERVIFERVVRGHRVAMVVPAAGGEPTPLLEDEHENQEFAWRSDGRRLVFRSSRAAGGTEQLFELDTASGVARQLTRGTKHANSFSVSADDRIAYEVFWHDTFLYAVDVETGEQRQLTSHTEDNFGARFSPDGRTLVYHSTRTGNSEIWLHPLDGGPETRFTDHPGWDLYADWSPDGQRLVFVSDRDGGRFKLFVANPDGAGGAQLLIDREVSWRIGGYSSVNTNLPSRWSPDGGLIGFMVTDDQGSALWTVEPTGEGERKRVERISGFDWYKDASRVVVSRALGSEVRLLSVNLETGEEKPLFEGALTEFDVAPDGHAVAFCYGRGHTAMGLAVLQLREGPDGHPQAVGEPEYVARSSGTWHVHNGGWSADSRQLVYTQDTDYGDIYELVPLPR